MYLFDFRRAVSPRWYLYFFGIILMWWPQKPSRWFRVRPGCLTWLVIDVGYLEIIIDPYRMAWKPYHRKPGRVSVD